MKHPCPIEEILSPNEVNWNEDIQEYSKTKEQYYIYWDPNLIDRFKYVDLDTIGQDADIIEVRTGASLLNKLSQNKNLINRIKQLGFKPSEFKLHYLMFNWYSKLFKLTDKLKIEYDSYLDKIKTKTLICAQIRIGGKVSANGISDEPFTNRKDTQLFWKLIQDKFIKQNTNYIIYVTSDLQEVKDEAKEVFGKDFVISNDKSSIHIEKDFKKMKSECENDSIKEIILDFHMLQMCDMAVVSQSGFGMLGLWNRKVPNKDLFVHTNQNLTNDYWDRKNLHFMKVENLDELNFI